MFEAVFGLAIVMFLLVFVSSFVFIARSFWRGPTGMLEDMLDRTEGLRNRLEEAARERARRDEPTSWTCSHCEQLNEETSLECRGCGAPRDAD